MTNEEIQKLFEKNLSNDAYMDEWIEEKVCSKKEMDIFIKWLNQLNEEEIYQYIKQDSTIFSFISNQSNKLCNLSVINNPGSIRHVRNQTKELCELAIRKDPLAICDIREQTVDLCILALIREIKESLIFHNVKTNCYKNIKIVPNPDHETTLKNLYEKKAILEALK